MATASVTVISALSGEELLPRRALDCESCLPTLLAALGSRPSRPVTLFLAGAGVAEDFQPAEGAELQLSAVIGYALSEEERAVVVNRLKTCDYGNVRELFHELSADASDDPAIALAAVQRNGSILQYASEACRDEREIVLAAVQRCGEALQYAGDACRNDRRIVQAAVQRHPQALQYAGKACRNDRDIVIAAVGRNPRCLQYAGEECQDDKDIVLTAAAHSLRREDQRRWAGRDVTVIW